MNNYFTKVISLISSFDGDVIKFAGDSMIVAFAPNDMERSAAAASSATSLKGDEGLKAATLRCAQCAHQLATHLGHMRMKMNGQVEPLNKVKNLAKLHTESSALDIPQSGSAERSGMFSSSNAPQSDEFEGSDGVDTSGLLIIEEAEDDGWAVSGHGGVNRQFSSGIMRKQDTTVSSRSVSGTLPAASQQPQQFERSNVSARAIRDLPVISGISDKLQKLSAGFMSSFGMKDALNTSASAENAPSRKSLSGMSRLSANFSHHGPPPRTSSRGGNLLDRSSFITEDRESAVAYRGNISSSNPWGAEDDGVMLRELSVSSRLNLPPSLLVAKATGSTGRAGLNAAPASRNSSASSSPHDLKRPNANPSWEATLQQLTAVALSSSADPGQGSSRQPNADFQSKPEKSRLSQSSKIGDSDEAFQRSFTASDAFLAGSRQTSRTRQHSTSIYKHVFSRGVKPGVDSPVSPARSPGRSSGPSLTGPPPDAPPDPSLLQLPGLDLEWSDDSYMDPPQSQSSGAGQSGDYAGMAGQSTGGSSGSGGLGSDTLPLVRGPGPVAEGLIRPAVGQSTRSGDGEDNHNQEQQRSSSILGSDTASPRNGDNGVSFISRVVSLFSFNQTRAPDGPSNIFQGDPTPSSAEVVSEALSGSSRSYPSRVNSYSLGTGQPTGRSSAGSAAYSGAFAGKMNFGGGQALPKARGDPITEEVRNAEFSLKIMIGAGCGCVFHVGGSVDENLVDSSLPEVPHWEFFVADR